MTVIALTTGAIGLSASVSSIIATGANGGSFFDLKLSSINL